MINNIFYDRLGKKHLKPDDVKVADRHSVYGIAIFNNQILMIKPAWADWWELPGGAVEKGENEPIALNREWIEEIGYIVKEMDKNSINVVNNNFYLNENGDHYYSSKLSFFAVTRISKMIDFSKNIQEIKAIEWIKISDLAKLNINPIFSQVINNFINSLK